MRGGGEGCVGVIGAGTLNWPREFYNVEMQHETPERQGLGDLQRDMTEGSSKRFTRDRGLFFGCHVLVSGAGPGTLT